MGTSKLENSKRMKKIKKIEKGGSELAYNGESSAVSNSSKSNPKDDATDMNDDNVPAVEVKAHKSKKVLSKDKSKKVLSKDKSKKVRNNKKKDTLVSYEEGNVVNDGEQYEPAEEDCSKGKKDKLNTAHKNKRKRDFVSVGQIAEGDNGEETKAVLDGSKHKKDKSKRARKNKTKDTLLSSEQNTVVNDIVEIQPVAQDPSQGKKDKSRSVRKNKSKQTHLSSALNTVMNVIEECQPEAKGSSKGKKGKSKKSKKQRPASPSTIIEAKSVHEMQEGAMADVYQISSGEEDNSKGMKKWIKEYHVKRPGIKVLQEQIDDFITTFEEQEEQAKREKEANLAEDGWTVVVHRKGGKKTTDSESGVAVGSVAEAAVLDKMAKKKSNNVGLDFYRFQRKEAHRSEIMKLQSKFEEDKKRIQQIRAARKFRPY